jgi:hypothetical protein
VHEKAQDKLVEKVLKEHSETLEKHGFLPSPSKNASDGEVANEEVVDDTLLEKIEEEADELYTYFTSECPSTEHSHSLWRRHRVVRVQYRCPTRSIAEVPCG